MLINVSLKISSTNRDTSEIHSRSQLYVRSF